MHKQAKLILKLKGDETTLQIVGVYELSPPLENNKFVVVSSVDLAHYLRSNIRLENLIPSTETYIFPSNGKEITSWAELYGSQKKTMSHKKVLEDLGYQVEEPLS